MPVVAALNMCDVADSRGIQIDQERLSSALQSPVVRTVASKGDGIDDLVRTILETAKEKEA